MCAGEYFGEYSCLLGQERSASVVASSYVELYSLSRADLELVLQQWPELAEQFEAMGEC
jgi:CRP-like cAMP-binding protein